MSFRKRVRLLVRSRDNQDALADLVWDAGTVDVRFAASALRPAIERWVRHGVTLSAGQGPAKSLKHTQVDAATFLEDVHEYLSRTSGFLTRLTITVAAPLGFFLPAKAKKTRIPKARWVRPRFTATDEKLTRWTIRQLDHTRSLPAAR